MEAACLRHTEIPHTSKLFIDFQYHFDRVRKYYEFDSANPESYVEAAAKVQYPAERRANLISALRPSNPNSRALERLAQAGTVAVVTGQQVGLFSGPAYTVYKALTAAKIARQLSESGVPAVAMFWLATNDHDLAEVDHAYVFGTDHQPRKLVATVAGEPQQPVGTMELQDVPVAALREALQGFPFGEEVIALAEEAYRAGATLGNAFRGLLQRLLERLDLVFVDPMDEAVRAITAPFLREALATSKDLHRQVMARSKELVAEGYHAQVLIEQQTSFFFVMEGHRRITLKRQNGSWISKERQYSAAELSARAEDLSPNALLRPVMQDYLLPTVAYVGGGAELAYLAQSKPLYESLIGHMPVVVSRNGFTLLDARAHKLMGRYGLGLPCFFHGEDCLRDKIAAKLVPEQLRAKFSNVGKATEAALEDLGADLRSFDPTLEAALGKSKAKILYQLGKMEGKAAREALRRDERGREESRFLSGLVFPDKKLQERHYSILPFLAKHGFGLLDDLFDAVNPGCPDHRIVTV